MLNELKNLRVNQLDMDELMSLSTHAKGMKAEFERNQVEIPEWLDDTARQLQREITSKNADAIALRVRQIKQKISNLKTPAERRTELEEELQKLQAVGS